MSIVSGLSLAVVAIAAAYLVVGHLWHRVLAPLPAPDPATFPRAGDRFGSRAEGVEQQVHDVAEGWVVGAVTLAPGAEGPPMHVHYGFSETFAPTTGILHVQLRDRVVRLHPGESLFVPPGMPHRPFNPGDTEVVVAGTAPSFPRSFAAALVQLYRVMDERGTARLTMLMQMSVADPIFDTHLAGVPRAAEQVLRFALAPTARLAGFRNYYPEYALHPPGAAS